MREFLRPKEVSEILGIPLSTIYDRLNAGLIPHERIGRSIVVPRRWVEELKRQMEGAPMREFLRPREVSKILGVPLSTIYDRLNAGLIPHERIGRSIVVPRRWVEELKNQMEEMGEVCRRFW